jgi:hypothetical protein
MTIARIFKPAKTAMQSGTAAARAWVLEYAPEEKKAPDALMGWAGSGDMQSQIRLKFKTREQAEDYAKRKGLDYTVATERVLKPKIKTYAENFK